MIYNKIDIQVSDKCVGAKSGLTPFVTTYLPSNSEKINPSLKRKTVLILPGGGYGFVSPREAEPIALKLMAMGFNAVVLTYSVAPATFPVALCEVASAISMIRENADEWNVDTDKIVVAGFSAGAHLAGSMGTLWYTDFLEEQTGLKKEQFKPNGLMLGYPVVSLEHPHVGSFKNLLGGSDEFISMASIEKNVTNNTPKTFMWHTFSDPAVPMENSLVMASALKKCDVPFELHIFPEGPHGLSLADETTANEPSHLNPQVAKWFDMFITWLNNL